MYCHLYGVIILGSSCVFRINLVVSRQAKRKKCSTTLCTAKFVSKPYTSKRPPLGNLFHLNNCVKKMCMFHSLPETPACLPVKMDLRHNFLDLHIFSDMAFFT